MYDFVVGGMLNSSSLTHSIQNLSDLSDGSPDQSIGLAYTYGSYLVF